MFYSKQQQQTCAHMEACNNKSFFPLTRLAINSADDHYWFNRHPVDIDTKLLYDIVSFNAL